MWLFLEYAKERNDYKFPIFTARPCVCFGFVSLKPNAINLRNVPQNCVFLIINFHLGRNISGI